MELEYAIEGWPAHAPASPIEPRLLVTLTMRGGCLEPAGGAVTVCITPARTKPSSAWPQTHNRPGRPTAWVPHPLRQDRVGAALMLLPPPGEGAVGWSRFTEDHL
ncbi:MAG: hypothetical protein ACRDND_28240, partial [Streptosporangiaceae bacterium]